MSDNKIHTELTHFDDYNLLEVGYIVKGLSQVSQFSYVVTPNIDHLYRLVSVNKNNELLQIYRQADLSLCDSRILEKMLKLRGKKLKSAIAGSDLTRYLFDSILTTDDAVLIVGSTSKQILILKERYPQLHLQQIEPSMGFIDKPDEVKSLLDKISKAKADYIFLALGSPRQEVLAAKLKASGLSNGVALCIGASINFLTGAEKRAPKLFQALHLEWLYRMLQNPRRLIRRYFLNALYLPSILRALK